MKDLFNRTWFRPALLGLFALLTARAAFYRRAAAPGFRRSGKRLSSADRRDREFHGIFRHIRQYAGHLCRLGRSPALSAPFTGSKCGLTGDWHIDPRNTRAF